MGRVGARNVRRFYDRKSGRAGFAGAFILSAILAACAPPPPALPTQIAAPPAYGDPLSRLHKISAAGIPQDRPIRAGDKVALVASDNVGLTLAYLDLTRNLLANSRAPGANFDPAYVVKSTVNILRRRYPKLALYEDLRSAQRDRATTTLIFDIRVVAAQAVGQSNSAEIDVIALDGAMRPLSQVVATGRNSGTSADIVKAVDVALASLRDKSGDLLR